MLEDQRLWFELTAEEQARLYSEGYDIGESGQLIYPVNSDYEPRALKRVQPVIEQIKLGTLDRFAALVRIADILDIPMMAISPGIQIEVDEAIKHFKAVDTRRKQQAITRLNETVQQIEDEERQLATAKASKGLNHNIVEPEPGTRADFLEL